MKNTKLLLFILIHITGLHSLQAQNEVNNPIIWTLQDCLDYARQHNLQIKQLSLQEKVAKINHKQSKDDRLPNLNGTFSHGVNVGRTIDRTTNSFTTDAIQFSSLQLNSNFIVYNGHITRNTIAQRELEHQLAQLTVEETANNLNLSILSAYLQILLAEEQEKILAKQSELTQKQYEQTQKLVKVGSLPAGDLLDIEAQLGNDELNIVNAENTIQAAYLNLSQLLDLYEQNIQVARNQVDVPSTKLLSELSPQLIYETALSTQPQIKTATLRTQIAEKGLKIAEGGRWPTVALSAQLSSNFSSIAPDFDNASITGIDTIRSLSIINNDLQPVFELVPELDLPKRGYFGQLGDNAGGFLGLSVSVPIFNNFRVRNGIELAKINIDNTRFSQELTKNNLRKAIEQAYLDAQAAAKRYESTQKNIVALEKSMAHAEKKFELGMVTALEYLTTKNNLTRAELNVEAAKFEYIFRLKILDFYQGKPLEFGN